MGLTSLDQDPGLVGRSKSQQSERLFIQRGTVVQNGTVQFQHVADRAIWPDIGVEQTIEPRLHPRSPGAAPAQLSCAAEDEDLASLDPGAPLHLRGSTVQIQRLDEAALVVHAQGRPQRQGGRAHPVRETDIRLSFTQVWCIGMMRGLGLDPLHQRLDLLRPPQIGDQNSVRLHDHSKIFQSYGCDDHALGRADETGLAVDAYVQARGTGARRQNRVPRSQIGPVESDGQHAGEVAFLHDGIVDRKAWRGAKGLGQSDSVVIRFGRQRGPRGGGHFRSVDVDFCQ